MVTGKSTARSPESSLLWNLFAAALFAGFGEYAAVAALADVAKAFGHVDQVATVASVVGLSGSVLGIGLAVLRLSSLAALPVASLADRWGRVPTLRWCLAAGLALTVVAAAAPNYWIFVACFAVGRPFLSAALTLIQVVAVELSSARQRVRRLSIVAAGSGGGAGIASVLHGLIRHGQEFRVLFALALIPLATLWPLVRSLPETHRHIPPSKLGLIPRPDRSRLLKVGILMGSTGLISGPANGFLFVYGESLLKVPPRNLALIVTTSALAGLLGLGLSRFVADRCGRRFTVWIGICGTSLAGALAYFGGYDHFVYGFYGGVFAAGLLTPSLNALSVELFAPSIRATVGGWVVVATVVGATTGLVAFGALTGTGHVVPSEAMRHAALWTFLPAIALAGVVWLLPETHHHELDDISVRSA